jgi:PAS domain S-box-containing protein
MLLNKESLKDILDILKIIFDNVFEGVVIIDRDGVIKYANRKYGEFWNMSVDEVIGRHVTEISECSGTYEVLIKGKRMLGEIVESKNGKKMVINRFPIKFNGEIVGAIGIIIFSDLDIFKDMIKRYNFLENKIESYKRELANLLSARYSFRDIKGISNSIRESMDIAYKVSHSSLPILITGESGTGKELFAHAIHNNSDRKHAPFIKINCSSIPKELFESELFGYEPHSFTGADRKSRIGKFELADKGTIFLDEVGDMPIEMQSKLLRVSEDKEIERIGGHRPIKVDFRLISATNQDLEKLIEKEKFRLDLYYRINVIRIDIPPLRIRKEDIPILISHTLKKIGESIDRKIKIEDEAIKAMMEYDYPGNVRELNNILERICYLKNDNLIRLEDIPYFILNSQNRRTSFHGNVSSLKRVVEEAEKRALIDAFSGANGNIVKASKILGIHRTGFYKKMRRYGLELK